MTRSGAWPAVLAFMLGMLAGVGCERPREGSSRREDATELSRNRSARSLIEEAIGIASATYDSTADAEGAHARGMVIHANLLAMGDSGLRELEVALQEHYGERVFGSLLGYVVGFRGPRVRDIVVRAMCGRPPLDVLRACSAIVEGQAEDWSLGCSLRLSYCEDALVRVNAVGGLRHWRRTEVSDRLVEVIQTDEDERVRRNAVLALGAGAIVGHQEELRVLCDAAMSKHLTVRSAARGVLARLVADESRPGELERDSVDWSMWFRESGRSVVWDVVCCKFVVLK